MPINPTYPGVYIEELPSGVRTITGVATSITAFVGRALRGPLNTPTTIFSFGEFERAFGGLWVDGTMSFAVRDFFANGGSQAVIVRLYRESMDGGAVVRPEAQVVLANGGGNPAVTLQAANPGTWGDKLGVAVSQASEALRTDVAEDQSAGGFAITAAHLFDLTITDGKNTEEFRNLTLVAGPRQITAVLKNLSGLVRVSQVHDAATLPANGTTKVGAGQGGSDGEKLDQKAFIGPHDPDTRPAAYYGSEGDKRGLYALENVDLFNLLCLPPYAPAGGVGNDIEAALWGAAAKYCHDKRAFLIADAPHSDVWKDAAAAIAGLPNFGITGDGAKNAAVFFPRLVQPNPLKEGQLEQYVPCGAVAGIFARTDVQRGVWKAPAGLDATLVGVTRLQVPLTDNENGQLNPLGLNCLRSLPPGLRVVWGARTRKGHDQLASQWKYIPVRRLALYIEETLYRALQWVVFEPNDEPLWAQIRLNVGGFMNNLFRQGAFQGSSPADAYLVKCDSETTTQNDIDRGIVNIVVGFAPLKPAEFVILKLQQLAGQAAA